MLPENHSEKWAVIWHHLLPISVCVVYLIVALYVGQDYVIGAYGNSDFYGFYAADAKRIANGEFPQNTFNGPGYPLVLSATTAVTGDLFIAGKWIAAFSASLSGLIAYYWFRSLFGFRTAIMALPLILVAGEYALFAIEPGTDLIFLLLCLTTMFTITSAELGVWQKAILAGILSGFAYLTRYNGIFLPVTFVTGIVLFNCLELPLRKRLQVTAAHIVSVLVTISPWLWLNYVNHGSPFYNTNYLNMATVMYGYKVNWDGVTEAAQVFKSFGDVVFHDPKTFISHYLSNIAKTITRSLSGKFLIFPIGLMVVAAIPLVLTKLRQRAVLVFFFSFLLYLLVMSFNHWENRYFFYVMVCYIALASYLVITTADWISRKGWLSSRLTYIGVYCIGIAAFSITSMTSSKMIVQHIKDQPYELIEASRYLKNVSANEITVVARKPHLAFMINAKKVFFPPAKSLDELHESLSKTPADYLVYDRSALEHRPDLKMLAEPVGTISWLRPVYSNLHRPLVIYRIVM